MRQEFDEREDTLRYAQENTLKVLEQERSRVRDTEQVFSGKLESFRIEVRSAAKNALDREAAFTAESRQLASAHIEQIDKLQREQDNRERELRDDLDSARAVIKLDSTRFQTIEHELSKSLLSLRNDLASNQAEAAKREQVLHSALETVRIQAAKDIENLTVSFERILAEIRDDNRIREQDLKSQLALLTNALQIEEQTNSQREQVLMSEANHLRTIAESSDAIYRTRIDDMGQDLQRVQQELATVTLDSKLLEEALRAQLQMAATQLAKVVTEIDARTVELHNLRTELDSKQSALLANQHCAEDLAQLGSQYSRYVDFLEGQPLVRLFHTLARVANWFGVVRSHALNRPSTNFPAVRESYGRDQPNSNTIQPKQDAWLKDITTRTDDNHAKETMEKIMDIEQLLDLSDVQFVQAAYREILKREPDATGERTYVEHLRRGLGKVEVLRGLADSAEARALGPLRKDLQALISATEGKAKRNIELLLNWYAHGRIQSNRMENLLERSVDSLDVIKKEVEALAGRVSTIERQSAPSASIYMDEISQELKRMSTLVEKLARPAPISLNAGAMLRVHPSAEPQAMATATKDIRLRADHLQRLRKLGNRPDSVSEPFKSAMAEVRKKLNGATK